MAEPLLVGLTVWLILGAIVGVFVGHIVRFGGGGE